METAAAFFETRRYASMLGATAEFEKQEGITVSKLHSKVWFSTSVIRNGMTNSPAYNFCEWRSKGPVWCGMQSLQGHGGRARVDRAGTG
jgi:hypothetical protein